MATDPTNRVKPGAIDPAKQAVHFELRVRVGADIPWREDQRKAKVETYVSANDWLNGSREGAIESIIEGFRFELIKMLRGTGA